MAKSNLRQFDYKKVAELDCRIWQAYYSHKFLQFSFLTLRLLRTQLKLNMYRTVRMAYFFAVASAEYRLNKKHMSSNKTLKYLIKFYRIISANCTEPFNFTKAAELELDWWNIQRYNPEDRKALELGLAKPFAVVYDTKAEKLLPYGRYRTDALYLKNKYFHEQKIEPRWQEINNLLLKSWHSLYIAVENKNTP